MPSSLPACLNVRFGLTVGLNEGGAQGRWQLSCWGLAIDSLEWTARYIQYGGRPEISAGYWLLECGPWLALDKGCLMEAAEQWLLANCALHVALWRG